MIRQYETAINSEKYHQKVNNVTEDEGFELSFDSQTRYQTILGFGGAFTEAAAYTFYKMPLQKREAVINAYFNKHTGLGYNLGRVSIHSCDFSLENYTYVEENDVDLSSFSIERDLKYVIPMIKEAQAVANEPIQILASPWSPPAWMKTNNDMNHGGSLLDMYKQPWANYYIKFLDAYKKEGIDVFALTVQNEPAAKQVWDSCLYSKEEERDFVKDYLGPTLVRSPFKDTKLLIWDHNRDIIVDRARAVFEDEEANKYVWGTGFHWYMSEAFENLTTLHNLFPNKHLLFTEGTIEGGVALGQFKTGERYARNMIGDFNNYCEGYIDWNLLLDEQGGPNHVGNYCDAPIIYDTQKDVVHYNSSYYAIGHFSKYVLPGARRIQSSLATDTLGHVTFENPNGDIIIVLQNETTHDEVITIKTKKPTHITIKARSISTVVIGRE